MTTPLSLGCGLCHQLSVKGLAGVGLRQGLGGGWLHLAGRGVLVIAAPAPVFRPEELLYLSFCNETFVQKLKQLKDQDRHEDIHSH